MPDYKVFPLPDTAEGLVDAEILSWHIKPGDAVEVNQIIVEIETAKAAVELPCPWAGVVTELHAQPGQTVNVGEPIVTIDIDPGGAAGAPAPQAETNGQETNGQAMLVGYGPKATSGRRRPRTTAPAAVAPPVAAPPVAAPPVPQAPPKPITVPDSPAVLLEPSALVPLAKPPVRKLAKDLGVDLRSLVKDGVITREDVQRAAQAPAAPVVQSVGRERRVPVRGVRKMTAQAMVESAYSAPHVTEFLTIDVTPMMELRARLKTHPAFRDVKITPLTFASPAVMLNGTFTITNVGVFGVDTGTPIINPGESAILALGAIRDMPWVVDGEIRVRKVCQLSLSFDHRVVDGQQGSQFLADVGAILADPAMAVTF
jgi:2-oxoisovalerate dehydrogenase E2 component (dihydrolipoyl transacylase)